MYYDITTKPGHILTSASTLNHKGSVNSTPFTQHQFDVLKASNAHLQNTIEFVDNYYILNGAQHHLQGLDLPHLLYFLDYCGVTYLLEGVLHNQETAPRLFYRRFVANTLLRSEETMFDSRARFLISNSLEGLFLTFGGVEC